MIASYEYDAITLGHRSQKDKHWKKVAWWK
ncbi:Protein of unknown function [Bacillus mycoides]|nr:Protein of unknown function [Bacillus mycoides]